MTGDEFVRLAQSLYGTGLGWRRALARQLDVDIRTVQRWCNDGPPDRIPVELMMSAGVACDEGLCFPRDEWISGDGPPTEAGQRRNYIIHTRMPRFIARIVRIDEETEAPDPVEGDVERVGVWIGLTRSRILCEIQWIDRPPPTADLAMLMEAACDALDDVEDADEDEDDSSEPHL